MWGKLNRGLIGMVLTIGTLVWSLCGPIQAQPNCNNPSCNVVDGSQQNAKGLWPCWMTKSAWLNGSYVNSSGQWYSLDYADTGFGQVNKAGNPGVPKMGQMKTAVGPADCPQPSPNGLLPVSGSSNTFGTAMPAMFNTVCKVGS